MTIYQLNNIINSNSFMNLNFKTILKHSENTRMSDINGEHVMPKFENVQKQLLHAIYRISQ